MQVFFILQAMIGPLKISLAFPGMNELTTPVWTSFVDSLSTMYEVTASGAFEQPDPAEEEAQPTIFVTEN